MILIDKPSDPYFKVLAGLLVFELGDKAVVSNDYSQYGTWILFWPSFKAGIHKRIGRSPYIALHTEQVNSKGSRDYEHFLECSQEVWSWSKESLHPLDPKKIKPFVFGYSDFYRLQMEDAKDIDILFYGAWNDLRFDILGELPSKYRVMACRGFYGKEAMALIMRAKIVLSIHYYGFPQNDMPRIAPLLCVKACVVCQETVDEEFNSLTAWLNIQPANGIASACEALLKNPVLRLEWADRGFDYIRTLNESHALV